MAKQKKNEQVEEVKEETTAEEKTEQAEETKDDLFASVATHKATLLKNIKHNQVRFKIGDEIELTEEELAHFKKLRLVKDDQ